MSSAILPARLVARASGEAIANHLAGTKTGIPLDPMTMGLLEDLQAMAGMADHADGTVILSLDHFSLIRPWYKPR